jgi:hypothetical protein
MDLFNVESVPMLIEELDESLPLRLTASVVNRPK